MLISLNTSRCKVDNLLRYSSIFGLKYSFEGKELGKDTINDTMEKASDFAQNIVDEIKE